MYPSAKQIEQFQEDGFLILPHILEPDQTARALAGMDRVYAGIYNHDQRPLALQKPVSPFGSDVSVHWILNARVLDKDLWSVATDPGLGEFAAALLGSSAVSIVEDQLLDKPGYSVPVNVHQDYSYWQFSSSANMATCWIALCDMTADMGAVEMIRGSHRWDMTVRPRELVHGSDQDYLSALESVRHGGAALEFETAIVPAGGGVFLHSKMLHGSRRNTTQYRRRAMSLHWAAKECRLNREKLVNYDCPYFFARLKDGDQLVNKYMPQVFPPAGSSV
jgi:phytanoyl-CoA hydroxylase